MPYIVLSALLSVSLFLFPQIQAGENLTESEVFVQQMSALASDGSLILFRAGSFDPTQGIPSESSFALSEFRDTSEGRLLYVAQFGKTPGDIDRGFLNRLGAEILYYIPNNAYLVRLHSSQLGALSGHAGLRAAFRLPKFAKVDSLVPRNPSRVVDVEVIAAPGGDGVRIAGLLRKQFPELKFTTTDYHHKDGRVVCSVPSDRMDQFLDYATGLEDVLNILPWEPKKLLNDNSIWVIQNYDTTNTTNYALSATLWNHGITGTGQIVCDNDSGMTNTLCEFRYTGTSGSEAIAQTLTPPDTGTITPSKKVIAYYVEPGAAAYDHSAASYHGTHTCGSILGDNYATLSTPTSGGHDNGDGMAPNAQLVMQDVGDTSGGLAGLAGDLDLMFLQAYNAGARIHSDSWGTELSNYDGTSMDMDEFTYRHEDFLFVVAMGNSGTAPGDGSIGAPGTAKDIVSVGATTNGSSSSANNLQPYSRGPVDDGRRKPDVCSPGSNINSANGGAAGSPPCGTQTMSGTSMATPTTAGGLTLLRQYFTDGWYPTGTKTAADARNPSAALMKACLINGAMEMTGTDLVNSSTITRIPSMDQGWGRTHLENGLYFSGDTRRLRVWDIRNANGLTTGQQTEYTINVASNTQPLKVHLVWTDPESTTLAATNLVNNLDLEVVNPAGTTTYKGNVFATGQSTTGGTADVLNNVEGFVLNSPATGNWTLRVKATSVPGASSAPYSNRQGYALVAAWATCASSLAAPTGLTATNNGTTGIDLSWNTVSGATGYIVYKAVGASPAAGDYSVLVQQAGIAFTDTKVQGGYTYWYKVRATDNCSESPLSSAASATYTGNCALYPTFSGIGSVTNDLATPVCDLVVAWPAATSNCPLGATIRYNIYRGTTPYFTLNGASRVATGVSGTTYTDYSVNGLTTYYYVVRAEDSTTLNGGPNNGGNEDTNTKMIKGTPWASTSTPGTFTDDGGDTNAKLSLTGAWRVTNQQFHGGAYCYHNANDGSSYPPGMCAAATTPPLTLTGSAQLSYWIRYNVEWQWDGVVVEISTNGGSSWTALVPTEGYTGDFSTGGGVTSPINACLYALTRTCFNGPNGNAALTAWTQYHHDLSSFSGQTALIRWNFSSDGGAEFEGFYLDDIQVTNASVNDACATRDGQVTLDASSYTCAGDTIGINLADFDLKGTGTYSVTIASTFPDSESVVLTETPANSGSFSGSISTATSNSAGVLALANGNTVTVTYIDADDGHGGTNVTKTDTATADCILPVITNVQAVNITYNSADITWTTNENADGYVGYDTVTPPVAWNASSAGMVTSHSIHLPGLSPCTTYHFFVRSTDPASNQATDTNGGSYYSFDTPQLSQPTYTKTETPPLAIPDNTPAGVSSVINVADNKTVQKIVVTVISLTHTYDGDLTLSLIGPDATAVTLSAAHGGTGENYTATVFDDASSTTIASGTPPYTGTFKPDSPLSAFIGKNSLGNWSLHVVDGAGGDTGTINAWSITLTYPAQACGPHAKYSTHARVADTCSSGGAGNNNGYWDAGEQVQFSLTLENDGTVQLTGITAVVVPLTAGVGMTDGTASYNAINAGATGVSIAPHFTVQLPDTLACGDTVNFRVDVTSAQGSWSSTFSQVVGQIIPGVTTPISEAFTTGNPPTGWTRINGGTGTQQWTTANPGAKCAAWPTSPFEIIDSDYDGSGVTQDDSLISPAFDSTGATLVQLSFDAYYYAYSSSVADVDVSIDNGGTWTSNVAHWTTTSVGSCAAPSHQTIDITTAAGSHTQVKVRFHYTGSYGWYWLVDNVQVAVTRAATCNQTVCPASGPNVQYDSAYNPVASLSQVCGDGDGVVEPGEDWQVTVRLKNTGSSAATATVGSLTVNAGSAAGAVILSGNPGSYGTMAAGGTATANYTFRVDPGVVCNKNLVFDITSISSTEKGYASQIPAFTVQVGGNTSGGNETATQVTTPLNATSNTVNSNLTAAFTLNSTDTATLSYTNGYTQKPGGTVTLFTDDFTANLGNWTTGGNAAWNAGGAHCTVADNGLARMTAPSGSLTLTTAVSTVGYTGIHLLWQHKHSNNGCNLAVEWYNGTTWAAVTGSPFTGNTTWQCSNDVTLPAGAEGNANLKVRFTLTTSGTTRTTDVDYVRITGVGAASGSWAANARVSLVDPSLTVTVLKGYGAADGSPYNVKAYFTGPGTYQIRLEENNGGTATVTAGSMNVVQNGVTNCTVASCGSAGPKPVPDGRLSGTAMKGTRATVNGSQITVTYDTGTCTVADHSIIYGNLANVASLTPTGGQCGIGNTSPYNGWTTVPTGYDVWWVIVGDSGTMESSWGQKYMGGAYSERSAGASNQCGNTAINTTSTCP